MADEYESDFIDKAEEDEDAYVPFCDDEEAGILDTDISPDEFEGSKVYIRIEFSGYDNGHCTYMICGIADEDAFKNYIARVNLKLEAIGGYKFNKETRTAWFDTCEKHGPELTRRISKAFPEVTAYGTDQWDSVYFNIFSGGVSLCDIGKERSVAGFKLDECFEDFGDLRINIAITDKVTGSEVNIGDMIYLYNSVDVETIEEDPTFSRLASLVGHDSRIDEAVEDCRKYHEKEEERG